MFDCVQFIHMKMTLLAMRGCKKPDSATIETDMISSVLSVLSCYITCIAYTFQINGIKNKTHCRGNRINTHSNRQLTPPLHLQSWKYISARDYIVYYYAPCAYRYNKDKFVRRKMY